jgi:RNA polymerase sigma-70 factor (ECF subfamily)
MDDKTAIKKIKQGEIEYFSRIVKGYSKVVLSFVNKLVFDKSEVDDIVQDTFLQFYKNIRKFDEKRPVMPYLLQIARNEVKMYIRSKKKWLQLNENIVADEQEEAAVDVEMILEKLPAEQRKALELVYEGHSYQEIAKTLKRPVNTVRTIIRRARLLVKSKHG